jgi:hypothetical protein
LPRGNGSANIALGAGLQTTATRMIPPEPASRVS